MNELAATSDYYRMLFSITSISLNNMRNPISVPLLSRPHLLRKEHIHSRHHSILYY